MDARIPPDTPAIRELQSFGVNYTPHLFEYRDKGGTSVSSSQLGISEHAVIKTLIMETETGSPLVVLMHGDCQVSTKDLARQIGAKKITPCKPEVANEHSGYLIGGTSPFGLRTKMPVHLEKTILEIPLIYINGGARGFLVSMASAELVRVLSPVLVTAKR
jgi:Cys-tRNA(Pro) deacylase